MKNRLVCLFGPTAVGKTDLLLSLVPGVGEVISVDSIQIYRELQIGSAKPDPKVLEKLPHHLINIRSYQEAYNVADFVRDAQTAAHDCLKRQKVPFLSGGAAFYFYHFLFGFPEAPASSEEVRKRVESLLEEMGAAQFRAHLEKVDPVSWQKIAPADLYRQKRALEVYYASGQPLSSFSRSQGLRQDFEILVLGLERPRVELYRRIDERVMVMKEEGLEEEVLDLRAQGAQETDPGMKAIGYREFFEGETLGWATKQVFEKIQQHSRNYAKRQMTFFRSLPQVKWFHPHQREEIDRTIQEFLSQP